MRKLPKAKISQQTFTTEQEATDWLHTLSKIMNIRRVKITRVKSKKANIWDQYYKWKVFVRYD